MLVAFFFVMTEKVVIFHIFAHLAFITRLMKKELMSSNPSLKVINDNYDLISAVMQIRY